MNSLDGQQIAAKLFSLTNDNFASENEASFASTLKTNSKFKRKNLSSLDTLQKAFQGATSNDPYYISPTYYALTGRRGLWVYNHSDTTALIFCLHPNLQDTILIFPPYGEKQDEIIGDLLKEISPISLNIQIARVPFDKDIYTSKFLERTALGTVPGFCVEDFREEEILDWKFPVHTISTLDIQKRRGKDFQKVRQAVNSLKAHTTTYDIDFSKKSQLAVLSRLAHDWENSASQRNSHHSFYEMDSDYFIYLSRIAQQSNLRIDGFIARVDGKDAGFAIWENLPGDKGIANLFASQAIRGGKSQLSKFIVAKAAENALQRTGITKMCLGGSESEGLDRFKRVFNPISSVHLRSIDITPIDDITYTISNHSIIADVDSQQSIGRLQLEK